MCDTCGCSDPKNGFIIRKPGLSIPHAHGHTHTHGHDHEHAIIPVEEDVLAGNRLMAERNRGWFEAKNIRTINLVSSPGAGKTFLLEKTLAALKNEISLAVIEGDQQTSNDAERIAALGITALQINTGNGCHLDAQMIRKAINEIDLQPDSLLFIENVGNLVCPALFDLGEAVRVLIMSVTEGEDKPLKYPNMFATSQVCIISKTDLLPHLDFDIEKARTYALRVNPALHIFELSARSGQGMETWLNWLRQR